VTDTKRCTKCGEVKPLDEFHVDKNRSDGRRSACKDCARIRRQEYYWQNRETALEKTKAYYGQNRETILEGRLPGRGAYRKCVKNPKCPAVGLHGAEFVLFHCEVCGKEFRRLKCNIDWAYENKGYLPKFCSRECHYASMRKDYKSPYARNIERIKKEVGAV